LRATEPAPTPDATLTLRLSYGEVARLERGRQEDRPFTDIAGAGFARETGADPFALPASWHAAKGSLNLAQRFNFVTSNDIIGGQLRQPDDQPRRARSSALIFDGNIHSLGGAFWFDPRDQPRGRSPTAGADPWKA